MIDNILKLLYNVAFWRADEVNQCILGTLYTFFCDIIISFKKFDFVTR